MACATAKGDRLQPVQLKMARAALGLSSDQLAQKVGLSHVDIARLEDGTSKEATKVERVRAALEGEGILWIDDDGVRYTGQSADAAVPIEQLTTANDGGVS